MKILKHGNTLKKAKCDRCNCEFEYRQIDIKVNPYQYKGIQYVESFLQCPECGEKMKK